MARRRKVGRPKGSGKKTRKKKGTHRKSPKRVAAGKKAARTRKRRGHTAGPITQLARKSISTLMKAREKIESAIHRKIGNAPISQGGRGKGRRRKTRTRRTTLVSSVHMPFAGPPTLVDIEPKTIRMRRRKSSYAGSPENLANLARGRATRLLNAARRGHF